MSDDDWLDVKAAAQWVGLGKTTVYRMIQRGVLGASGGRPNRLPRSDLAQHLERCQLESGALAALNDYSPTRWRPKGPDVADPARFEVAVAEVLAAVAEGQVVSYQWVATRAGYPTRAKAVRDHGSQPLGWAAMVAGDPSRRLPQRRRRRGAGPGPAGRRRDHHRSAGSQPSAAAREGAERDVRRGTICPKEAGRGFAGLTSDNWSAT